jgi:hypothetical protein
MHQELSNIYSRLRNLTGHSTIGNNTDPRQQQVGELLHQPVFWSVLIGSGSPRIFFRQHGLCAMALGATERALKNAEWKAGIVSE